MCQCALGGRISITMPPAPGSINIPSPEQKAAEQDAKWHEKSNTLKELAGGLALVGLASAVGGLFFPPLEIVATVALIAAEGLFLAAIVIDVAVAVVHPSVDNWLVVVGDVLAVGVGYALGKVVVGPAMGALARGAARMQARELGTVVLPRTGQAVQEVIAAEQAAARAARMRAARLRSAARTKSWIDARVAAQKAAAARAAKKEELGYDPQNGKTNPKSIEEAESVMQAEDAGRVINPKRPAKSESNLDFKLDGPEPYKWCDVKMPREPGSYPNTSIEKQSQNIAEHIKAQKGNADNVLHIVDLRYVPSASKAEFKANILSKLPSDKGVQFQND